MATEIGVINFKEYLQWILIQKIFENFKFRYLSYQY